MCLAWMLVCVCVCVCVLRYGLEVVGRTEVGIDEVGWMLEFHHRFWLPRFVRSDVFF